MNKQELINAISAEADLSKADAKKALDAFISTVGKSLENGEKVVLIGFGTFAITEKAERTGTNPATKQPIIIPARKVIKFKPGADLADKIK